MYLLIADFARHVFPLPLKKNRLAQSVSILNFSAFVEQSYHGLHYTYHYDQRWKFSDGVSEFSWNQLSR